MAQDDLSLMVWGAVILIIGIIFSGIIGDYIYDSTTLSTRTNETITIASGSGATAQDDLTALTYFGNASKNTDNSGLALGSELNWTKNGTITVFGNFTDNDYNISYGFEGDAYVTEPTSRVLFTLIPLLFVIGIFTISLVVARKGLEGLGLL